MDELQRFLFDKTEHFTELKQLINQYKNDHRALREEIINLVERVSKVRFTLNTFSVANITEDFCKNLVEYYLKNENTITDFLFKNQSETSDIGYFLDFIARGLIIIVTTTVRHRDNPQFVVEEITRMAGNNNYVFTEQEFKEAVIGFIDGKESNANIYEALDLLDRKCLQKIYELESNRPMG